MVYTGNGKILPCIGCYQLSFWVILLVVIRYNNQKMDKLEDLAYAWI